MLKILIAGDFAITSMYNPENISSEITDFFNNADFNIVNLEAPVTSYGKKIAKSGPHVLSHQESTRNVLKKLKIDAVTLANNHILDYGERGVKDTLAFCHKMEIKPVGAGSNKEEAAENLYFDSKEGKIAIINIAENEWASATDESAGANPMDIIDNTTQIHKAKSESDFVFVIIHGGHEYYRLPSPRMQKQYRFYADQGADIIIGHHTHCISGYEYYKNVPIFYSLGNFLFTQNSMHENWYKGLVLEIRIENKKLTTLIHPVGQKKDTFELFFLNKEQKNATIEKITQLSKKICDSKILQKEWKEYVEEKQDIYLNYWSPTNSIGNSFIRRSLNKLKIRFLNKKRLYYTLNLLRCEAHRDISTAVINNFISDENRHT